MICGGLIISYQDHMSFFGLPLLKACTSFAAEPSMQDLRHAFKFSKEIVHARSDLCTCQIACASQMRTASIDPTLSNQPFGSNPGIALRLAAESTSTEANTSVLDNHQRMPTFLSQSSRKSMDNADLSAPDGDLQGTTLLHKAASTHAIQFFVFDFQPSSTRANLQPFL
jgi:hypothetical protein